MSGVKRYDPRLRPRENVIDNMEDVSDGTYVEYSEYEKLQEKLDRELIDRQHLFGQYEKLNEENEQLRADAERLDWLEHKLFKKSWNAVIGSGSRTYWTVWGGFRHVMKYVIGNTFREAIDAALKKGGEDASSNTL